MIAESLSNFLIHPAVQRIAASLSFEFFFGFQGDQAIRSQISLAPESSPPTKTCNSPRWSRFQTAGITKALLKASQSLGPLVFMKSGSTWGHPATKETSWRTFLWSWAAGQITCFHQIQSHMPSKPRLLDAKICWSLQCLWLHGWLLYIDIISSLSPSNWANSLLPHVRFALREMASSTATAPSREAILLQKWVLSPQFDIVGGPMIAKSDTPLDLIYLDIRLIY